MIVQQSIVQYCPSLGKACGIASYTELLCEEYHYKKIRSLSELDGEIPTHLHLQHEFGIFTSSDLMEVVEYCHHNHVKFYITMHAIVAVGHMPFPKLCEIKLISFLLSIEGFLARCVQRLDEFLWKDRFKIYNWICRNKQNFLVLFEERKKKNSIAQDKDSQKSEGWIWKPTTFPRPLLNDMISSERIILENADKIIVHTNEGKQKLLEMGAKSVESFPHPLKIFPTSKSLHSQKDGKLHVGYFGFLFKFKSISEIIDACEQIDNVILHVFASTVHFNFRDQAAHYEEISNKISLKNWIQFESRHLPLEEIVFRLSQNDVNVWYTKKPPGISTSGSIRQYLVAKRPIIASDNVMIYDLKNIVQIVPSEDPKSLTEAIKNFNPDTSKIEEYVQRHTWDLINANYT